VLVALVTAALISLALLHLRGRAEAYTGGTHASTVSGREHAKSHARLSAFQRSLGTHSERRRAATRVEPRAQSCRSARKGLVHYHYWLALWRERIGAADGPHQRPEIRRSCDWTRRAASLVRARAHSAKLAYYRWRDARLNRYRRLYEKYRCIHELEGAWDSETANGYHGGLQFDDGFQRTYGPEFMRRWGNASAWPVWAQLEAAERAFYGFAGYGGRGFSPWGTRGACGL
jgi:hypothetical protein